MTNTRSRAVFAIAAVAVLAMSACTSQQPTTGTPTTATDPDYAAQLRNAIPTVMTDNAIPGVVVMVQSPSKGDWTSTFGTAELGQDVPMAVDDYLRIGSNTKTMTSTVILQLVQEGALSLDDPISKFRPDVPGGDDITIADLSEMRSGLYSYTFDPAFNATLDAEPQKAWTADELLAIAFSHPANAAPNQVFDYSNTNIVLLGVVIEQLTGMSASEAFDKRIFEPLDLTHTHLPVPEDSSIPDTHPQGYQFGTNVETIDSYAVPAAQLPEALNGTLKPLDQTNANPSWAWTAGGAISTPTDLAAYVKALVGGGLLDENTQKLRLDSVQPMSSGSPKGLGYGLGIAQFAPGIFGHDGQLPGFSSFMAYNLDTGDTIIVGTNLSASPVDGQNAAVVIAKSIIGTLYGSSDVPGGSAATAPTSTSEAPK
ncbi:serine hydrolase domain-containing protein [Rhodococcus sp. P1Y]|uniref:serine hydrolase domain-containing protein n=1 Tax=Rhodococcus sp. P1Y TaxID=1302308 RepID=UPI000EB3C8E6|nr:serine hydrolase domain-containing protein [Rhodococcus sp. P1Y]AYJ48850.1 class A beta-lactamase-related serine hydrolase [Rhodococcus sp. P1Y]